MRVYVKNNKGYGKNMLIACMMADIAEVLSYLPTAIIVGAVYALVAGIVLRLIGKRAASSGNTPGKVPFGENIVIYIVVVLMTVFFSRELGSREGIDMRILGTWGITMQDPAWVIENVLLFIPLGLLLPFWFPTGRKGIVIIVGLVCSIGIEVTQLVTGYGFCQLDDVIMNTAGTSVGYLLYVGIVNICRRTMARRLCCLLLAIVWMTTIFRFSAQPADESGQMSLRFGMSICRMVVPHFEDKTVEQQETMARRIEFPVRKAAHMTEYAILALLLLGTITKDRITRKQLLAVICLVAAYAATDEYHQLFVPGRSGQVRDVVIDTVGGTLGLGAWLAVRRLLTP